MPSIEGDITLSYFSNDDLVEELQDRGYIVKKRGFTGLISEAQAKRMRRDHDYREPITDKISLSHWIAAYEEAAL